MEKFAASARDTGMLPVVEATRHLMFHGVLNPSAAGITTKSAIAFVDGLCFRVFEQMDVLSQEFFVNANGAKDDERWARTAVTLFSGTWRVFEH